MRLSDDSSSDLFHLICGPLIGEGQYRQVFEHALDKSRVVKHDSGANFSNISEWELWGEVEGTSLEKWLAPVYWLSPRGLWLIQARTDPIRESELPKRVPSIFADLKASNWGLFQGRPVCHDYGNHAAYRIAAKHGKAMKRADWRT